MKKYTRDIWGNVAKRKRVQKAIHMAAEKLAEEHIRIQPIVVQKQDRKIETYAVKRTFHIDEAAMLKDEGIHNILAKDFLPAVKEMMDVEYVGPDMFNAAYIYEAKLDFVKPV